MTTSLTLSQLLTELREVSATVTALENRRNELILMGRELDASWAQLGEAMGVSKQAAWERYEDPGAVARRRRAREAAEREAAERDAAATLS